jgi:hypothetical protein
MLNGTSDHTVHIPYPLKLMKELSKDHQTANLDTMGMEILLESLLEPYLKSEMEMSNGIIDLMDHILYP